MTKSEHNHAVPLIGGSLCGESVTMEGSSLPKNIPMFYENKFYNYHLSVFENEHSYEVFYQFTNEVNEISNVRNS